MRRSAARPAASAAVSVIVEIEHGELRLGDEIAEQRAQLVQRLVVERDVVHHRDLRRVARDRAVALVDLADEEIAGADQRAGEGRVGRDEVLHHRAVHHRRRRGRCGAGSSRSCRWSVDLPLVPATPTLRGAALNSCGEQLGAGHQRRADARAPPARRAPCLSTAAEVTTVWSARVTPLPSCGKQRDAVARAGNRTSAPCGPGRARGRSRRPRALRAQDQRQRQHAAAADAAEEIVPASLHRRKLQSRTVPPQANASSRKRWARTR